MDHAGGGRIGRVINRELREFFPAGSFARAELRRPDDDPTIEPGQLMVRVLIPVPSGRAEYDESLAAWQDAHRPRMEALRRELSARLPEARLLEFTFDDPDPATPRIELPDDGRPRSGRDIVTTEPALAELLTGHLNEICDDKHLRVRARRPRPGGPDAGGPGPGPGREEPDDHEERMLALRRLGRLANSGIHRVDRLDANIGYLDLRRVPVPAIAGPAMAAAMELVAGTYALIIDLRRNGGGAPDGVVFWCSYLFGDQPTHLNDIFRADTGETRQFWALPYVPGPRYLDRPVSVLTSERTFSGGEDFAYTLQALGRAEVIGGTTGGGAHPTRVFPISHAVHIAVPFARSVNPVTGANWQGTGVVPDIAVPEAEALDVAYAKALRHVLDLADVPPPIEDEARRG